MSERKPFIDAYLRRERPTWGPRELRAAVLRAHPDVALPSASTIALTFSSPA